MSGKHIGLCHLEESGNEYLFLPGGSREAECGLLSDHEVYKREGFAALSRGTPNPRVRNPFHGHPRDPYPAHAGQLFRRRGPIISGCHGIAQLNIQTDLCEDLCFEHDN